MCVQGVRTRAALLELVGVQAQGKAGLGLVPPGLLVNGDHAVHVAVVASHTL